MRDVGWFAHPAEPHLPGLEVSRQAAADHRLAVDLDAAARGRAPGQRPAGPAHRSRRARQLRRGLATPFVAVTGLDGAEIASYTVTGLTPSRPSSRWSCTAGRTPGRCAPSARGTPAGSPRCSRDQGLPEAAGSSPTRSTRPWPPDMARSVARPRPGRPARRPEGSAQPPGGRTGHRRERGRPGGHGRPVAARPPARPDVGGQHPAPGSGGTPSPSAAPSARPRAGGPINYQHPRRAAAPQPPPRPQPDGADGQPVAGDAPGWSHGRAALQPGVGHVRGPRPHRRRLPLRRRLRRLPHGAASWTRSCPTRAPGSAPRPTRPAARPGPSTRSLVEQAQAVLDRDLAQLVAESRGRRARAPARATPAGTTPSGRRYQPPDGAPDGHAAGRPQPSRERGAAHPHAGAAAAGAWPVDRQRTHRSGGECLADADELRRLAAQTATALAARLLAVYPAGEFSVHVIDPAGSAPGRARTAGASPARCASRPPPGAAGVAARAGAADPARRPGADGRAQRRHRRAARRTSTPPTSC